MTSHNQEQPALCVRFVDAKSNIREEFVDFVYLQGTSGKDIADAIIATLEAHRLPITDIRGQGYDGAAAMSSNNVRVQVRIREVSPLAVYTHCSGHCLNLVIGSLCKY